MNWPTKIFFALVIALVVSLVAMVSRERLRTPGEVLQEVQAELAREGHDSRALLRRLTSALDRAESSDQSSPALRELCADLRIARGRILLGLGATGEARSDFEKVLSDYRSGDVDVRRLLVDTESASGQLEEAVRQLRQLLEEEPTSGQAWIELGRLERTLAEEALSSCEDKLRGVLIESEAQEASQLLRTLASLDSTDPSRATSIVALRELFPLSDEESLGQILGLAERASEHFSRCRDALVRSFAIELDPVALTRYLEILETSGRIDEALALGSLVAQQGPELADLEGAELLIRTLLGRGDYENASQLASVWVKGNMPLSADFLRLACQALLRGERWSDLAKAAFQLRSIGNNNDEQLFNLYFGLVQFLSNNKRPESALRDLTAFGRSSANEPFDGARELAWTQVALLQRERENAVGEREALYAALSESGGGSGELWLRHAEIQLSETNNGFRLPLESWAQAMSRLPERNDELFETFVELGEKALSAEERSLEVLYAELVRTGRSVPLRDYGPYVLYRLAEMHGENELFVAQVTAAQRLLETLPGFVPALDQLIAARGSLGDRREVIEHTLERIELTGLTDSSRALLATIDFEELSADQLVRVMRADPRGTGRMVVAAWLADNGRRDEALETLTSGGTGDRTEAETLFGARVQLAQGQYQACMAWTDRIPAESPLRPEALELAAQAAMRLGKGPEINKRVASLLDGTTLSSTEFLQLIDSFLESGNSMIAGVLIERLPEDALASPGPVLLRQIQVALLGPDPQTAAPLVERAAPFLAESTYLRARVLLAAERQDWSALAGDVEALRETEAADDPLFVSLLDLLSDREQAAAESASLALRLAADLPRWVLLEQLALHSLGQAGEVPASFGAEATLETATFAVGPEMLPHDPRLVGALLLMETDPSFTPFILGRLAKMKAREWGALWPRLLAADHLLARGRRTQATDAYRRLVRTHWGCAPAWDALELLEIEHYGNSLHPQLDQLREHRLVAQAKDDPQAEAGMLTAARTLTEQGDLASALRLTLSAEKLAPDWFEARYAVGRMYMRMGQWAPALETWRALVHSARSVDAPRAVESFLECLHLAALSDQQAVDLDTVAADLTSLGERFPDDPLVVLAQARFELRRETHNSALALERAWSRLRSLRERTAPRSLEELGRGATKAWAEFYVETDPDSAEEFLLSELALQPGNLRLWMLLGRVHRDLGRFDESYGILMRVALMSPSVEVQMELARTFVTQGASPRSVTRALQRADQLRRAARPLESQLLAAESLLGDFRGHSWEAAASQLERLWEDRHSLADARMRTRLASLFARALLIRGGAEDSAWAMEVLNEEFPRAEPPYEREHFNALAGIARSRGVVSQ